MKVALEFPDEVAGQLNDLPRALLEGFALEGYRSGRLTEEQVRKILGYETRMQVDGFLKEHGVYLNITLDGLDRDTETSRNFSIR